MAIVYCLNNNENSFNFVSFLFRIGGLLLLIDVFFSTIAFFNQFHEWQKEQKGKDQL